MRSSLDFKSVFGILALIAALVLSLPGVKAVRAEDQRAAAPLRDGPQCNASSPEAEITRSAQSIEQIQGQILSQLAAQAGSGADAGIVVLNNRGYNYGSGDADRIASDAQRTRLQH